MNMAADLAIDEINKAGGLLGRQVKKIAYDTQSNMALYTKYAQQITKQDKVDVVIGGILSASREGDSSAAQSRTGPLCVTPLYEGGVCDSNTFLVGTTPAPAAEVLVPYAMKKWGKKAYILAADYNYGQYMAKWFQRYLRENGGEAVSVDFFPLDVADFNSTIAKICNRPSPTLSSALWSVVRTCPSIGNGRQPMKAKIPMASTTLGIGNEHQVLTAEEGNGILVADNYSPELKSAANTKIPLGSGPNVPRKHQRPSMNWPCRITKASSFGLRA